MVGDTPTSLETVVERLLKTVGIGVPYADGAVFRTGDDNGKFRVIASERHVVCVPLECGNQRFCGVIPDLDCSVVARREKVRFVAMRVVVDMVDSLSLVGLPG